MVASNIFIDTPTWGNDPIWRAYFSGGLVQPPTRVPSSWWQTKKVPKATRLATALSNCHFVGHAHQLDLRWIFLPWASTWCWSCDLEHTVLLRCVSGKEWGEVAEKGWMTGRKTIKFLRSSNRSHVEMSNWMWSCSQSIPPNAPGDPSLSPWNFRTWCHLGHDRTSGKFPGPLWEFGYFQATN